MVTGFHMFQAERASVPSRSALDWKRSHNGAGLLKNERLVATVCFSLQTLAEYQVSYQPDHRQFSTVVEAQLFETPYRSPQLPLWDREEVEWLSVIRVHPYAARQRYHSTGVTQLYLFPEIEASVAMG